MLSGQGIPHLDKILQNGISGETFCDSLLSLNKRIKKIEAYDSLYSLNPYLQKVEDLGFIDSNKIRIAYSSHAYSLRRFLGDNQSAKQFYYKAHQLWSPASIGKKDQLEFYVEKPLGDIFTREGDYDKAAYFIEISVSALQSLHAKTKAARAMSNLGIVYLHDGRISKADSLSRHALDLSIEVKNQKGIAYNLVNLIDALLKQRRFKEVPEFINKGKTLLQSESLKILIEDKAVEYLACINEKELALEKLSKIIDYEQEYLSGNKSREIAKLYNRKAILLLESNQHHLAYRAIQKGLSYLYDTTFQETYLFKPTYLENAFMELYETLGDYYALFDKDVKIDSAIHAYRVAVKVHDQLRQSSALNNSKIISLSSYRNVLNKYIHLLVKHPSHATQEQIKYLTLHSKGKALEEQSIKRAAYKLLNKDVQAQYKQNQIRIAQLSKNSNLYNIGLLIDLTHQNNALLGTSIEDSPILSSPFIDFLTTDSLLIAIDNLEGKLQLNVVSERKVLDPLLSSTLHLIKSEGSLLMIHKNLRQLYDILLSKHGKLPFRFSVFLDGKLAYFPIDLLIDLDGKYLVENHEIDVRYSHFAKVPSPKKVKKVLCIKPDYERKSILPTDQKQVFNELFPLPYAKHEVDQIKSYFTEVDVINSIDLSGVNLLFEQSDIVHYCGHATSTEQYGQLILGSEEDKLLLGKEISHLTMDNKLIVLSACNTGSGESQRGEGVMSLARAFLLGGTEEVINSLWVVNDQLTAQLMNTFYESLSDGAGPCTALRDAKLDFINQKDHPKSHPYYWSSFVSSTQVKRKTENTTTFYLILSILVLISISSFILYKNKTN